MAKVAAKIAKVDKAAKVAGASRPRSWLWLQGLVCGAAISLLPAPSIVVAVLLAPAIMVAVVETTPKRPVAAAMGLLAAATAIGALQFVWSGGNSVEAAVAVVTDPTRVLLAWVFAGFGWLTSEGVAVTSAYVRQTLNAHRTTGLEAERSGLRAEWGDEPVE